MTEKKLLVLYASQTGNAEHIAKNVAAQLKEKSFTVSCLVMDEYDHQKDHCQRIIFVSSTTGDGDAPDNALKFWRNIRKLVKTTPTPFNGCEFTVLGLGDTNYSNFGAHPKKIEKKMLEMGAKVFYETKVADEVEGLENQVDPWIEGLLMLLCGSDEAETVLVGGMEALHVNKNTLPLPYDELGQVKELTNLARVPAVLCQVEELSEKATSFTTYDEFCHRLQNDNAHVKLATLAGVKCLTTKDALKRTLVVEIEVKDVQWKFRPGDSFGIYVGNKEERVQALLKLLGLDGKQLFSLKPPANEQASVLPSHVKHDKNTFYNLFKYELDISSFPKKALFRLMSEHTKSVDEKKMLLFLCSKQGAAAFRKLQEFSPDLADILSAFPECKPPVCRLIDQLSFIAPRYYSICSSPLKTETKLRIAFNVVEYENELGKKSGLCTKWLDEISGSVARLESLETPPPMLSVSPVKLPIFAKENHEFLLPEDASKPVIMVGPGTGVAPFIGFIEHRQMQLKLDASKQFGPMWLFYGCRDRQKDYLFKQELMEFEREKVLDKLIVCRSREPSNEGWKYVQDQIKANGSDVFKMMNEQGGVLYLCGDAKNMAKDVQQALVQVCQEHGKLDVEEAMELVFKWIQEKRYLKDVWG